MKRVLFCSVITKAEYKTRAEICLLVIKLTMLTEADVRAVRLEKRNHCRAGKGQI